MQDNKVKHPEPGQYLCRSHIYHVSQKPAVSAHTSSIMNLFLPLFLSQGQLWPLPRGIIVKDRWVIQIIFKVIYDKPDLYEKIMKLGDGHLNILPVDECTMPRQVLVTKTICFLTISPIKLDLPPNPIFKRNQEGEQSIILMANFHPENLNRQFDMLETRFSI